ncbi:glutamine ABC transporter ATP-binding protein (plasmid) [Antarctobacter heliothermus]|uniref:Glutamine ABC transporter ATP-binding protein n=1 Tax=Antarctobacter heliothermus TaxID=74033 RepID=A0A222EBL6_9RHOB|nr:ABC transporter ATP-binding protein [Antarctobacter heliothermus]ASP23586.1 glutamine ABC transporter ATP-binding protein [Antarctobacter heliothermus]
MVDMKTLRLVWGFLDQNERKNFFIVVAVVCVAGIAAVSMVLSIVPFLSVLANPGKIHESKFLKYAYDYGGFEGEYNFLMALGISSICVIILSNIMQLLKVYVIGRFSAMRSYSLSSRLLTRYLQQPYVFFLDQHTGELGKQLLSECQQVVDQAIKPAIEGFAAIVTSTMIVIVLLYMEPIISISAFLSIGAAYGVIIFFTRKISRRWGKVRVEANAQRYRLVTEAMAGIKVIKVLGRERFYMNLYSDPAQKMAKSQLIISVASQSPQYAIHAIMFSGIIVLCLALLVRAGLDGHESLAEIIPTIGLLAFSGQRILPELSTLFRSITLLSYGRSAVESIHEDYAQTKVISPVPCQFVEPRGLKSFFSFDSVTFVYPNADKPNLLGVSFSIQKGERIGVVGSTGSGKSTLANIVLGLIEPSQGDVIIDGVVLKHEDFRSWRGSVGYVPQDIFLTDLTVRENIAFGLPMDQIDEKLVIESAKIARIHDFILDELECGYDTVVGERGIRLSGGQRQRIGIARALYSQADLILFDEATSALDNATEKEVMQSIEALPGDKTLIMIAHRLSTLRNCDRIMVLRHGELIAFDSWENLERDCPEFLAMSSSANAA